MVNDKQQEFNQVKDESTQADALQGQISNMLSGVERSLAITCESIMGKMKQLEEKMDDMERKYTELVKDASSVTESLNKMSVFTVTIHSEINEFPTEKRYDSNIKISELKKKLELITGANHQTMKITLTVGDKKNILLDDNEKTLVQYVGEEVAKDVNIRMDVKDEQPSDLLTGDVPKYTISEEKYKERPNNVREFIKQTRAKLATE